MTIIQALANINIPPVRPCGTELLKIERLKTYFYKLSISPECNSNEEALELINNTLIEVEDCYSGILAVNNPELSYNGRMYPIQEDYLIREAGRIIARSKGNNIVIENNGEFTIRDRNTDLIIVQKIKQN
jgi:hypothetical protein